MDKITALFLALTFCYPITEGIDSSCVEESWNAFECIQSLQRSILELQEQVKNQEDQLNTQSNQLSETQENLGIISSNPVPIGFIYAQLPDQPEPHLLWDTVVWRDISSQYAGLFFRVLGGESEMFNVTQEESSPRITQINRVGMGSVRRNAVNLPSMLAVTTGSAPWLYTAEWGLTFSQSTAEVRPRNKAVRIWIRSN